MVVGAIAQLIGGFLAGCIICMRYWAKNALEYSANE